MELDLFEFSEDTKAKGIHKLIAFETGVLPTRCYFENGPYRSDDDTLVVEVTKRALEREPLRVPSATHPAVEAYEEEHEVTLDLGDYGSFYEYGSGASEDEVIAAASLFPERRSVDHDEASFGAKLDEILYVPFKIVVLEETT